MIMTVEEDFVEGPVGRVFHRTWVPAGEPERIVQIVHGYAEHSGRYFHLAETLVGRGAVVCAEDHVGHGRSDGERALITDFDAVVDAILAVGDLCRDRFPGVPSVLIGHSMGGLLSARAAQRRPDAFAGIVFCGSVIGDWDWLRQVLIQPDLPDVDFDPLALSRDPAVGAGYAADPLVYHGQYKRGLLEAEQEALDAYAREVDRLTMPVMFVHGTEDPFVPYQRSLQAVCDMPTNDLTVRVVQGGRHEVLNETDGEATIGAIADWLARVA